MKPGDRKLMTKRSSLVWTRVAFGLTVTLLSVTGCHKNKSATAPANSTAPTETGPAPTATITADPLSIDLGQSVVLNWRTTAATSVSIDGIGDVPVNGTQTVSPASSTNFHLVAKGDGGTTDASVRVTVRVPVMPSTPSGEGDMGSDTIFHSHVQDLFFDYDSYDLRPDAQTAISSAAAYLNSNPGIKVLIAGYCDDRGSAEFNITLGENRANAAKTALVSAGVDGKRIRVVSYGKERQFCSEETESCWQQNRRDQFSIDR